MTCCKKPSIANMDHLKWTNTNPDNPGEVEKVLHRLCMTCGHRQYKSSTLDRSYTRKEWELELQQSFSPGSI